MKTKIQAILEKVLEIRKRIIAMMGISHSQDDYAAYIKNIGGEVEKFLKDAVYENNKNNYNFYRLIQDLSTKGISNDSIDKLHSLREYYNSLKHDPTFSTSIIIAEENINGLSSSLQEINEKSIGKINENYIKTNSRVLWLCAWDDYLGGMTELNLFLPNYDLDFPYSIEYFNIALEGWDIFKNKYLQTGELQLGKKYVSEKAFKIWNASPDIIGVGRFTGDIKDLVKTLSSLVNKEREKKLIESLKRKNDSISNFTSIAYAIQDSLLNNNWKDFDDFKDEVKLRIDFDYGIEIDSKALDFYIQKLKNDFLLIEREELKKVDEILWLSNEQYDKEKIKSLIMEKPYIAINNENKIIVKLI